MTHGRFATTWSPIVTTLALSIVGVACGGPTVGGDAGAAVDGAASSADAPGACGLPDPMLHAEGAWAREALPSRAAVEATVRFVARPGALPTDAVLGLSAAGADDFAALTAAVRFAETGVIEARDGDAYRADAAVPYVAGAVYRFELRVRFDTRHYDVDVGPCEGALAPLIRNASFRPSAAGATSLDTVQAWTDGRGALDVGAIEVSSAMCVPSACGSLCGTRSDGCGGTLECGVCMPSDHRYGPDGTRWPTRTPRCEETPIATVASWDALVGALRTANAGDVIHLRTGDYGAQTLNDAAVLARASSWSENVLVCAPPGERPVFGALRIAVPSTSWAGLTIGGLFFLEAGSHHTRLAQSRLGAGCQMFIRSADDIALVEVAAPDRGENGDRFQIGPERTGAPIPRDLLLDGCWLEGTDVTLAGEHADNIQTLGLTGTFTIRDTFLGAAGNNASIQAGAEFQGTAPLPSYVVENVFFGGAIELGNGNVFGYGATTSYVGCEFDVNLRARADNTAVVTEMTGCRIEPAAPTMPDGTPIATLFPDNEYGVDIHPPAFTPPPWW